MDHDDLDVTQNDSQIMDGADEDADGTYQECSHEEILSPN